MTIHARKLITADEFLDWAEHQGRGRYELHDGFIVKLQDETSGHRRTKAAGFAALLAAVRRAGLTCSVDPDGATVRISESVVYEPDALVYCGPPLPDEGEEGIDTENNKGGAEGGGKE